MIRHKLVGPPGSHLTPADDGRWVEYSLVQKRIETIRAEATKTPADAVVLEAWSNMKTKWLREMLISAESPKDWADVMKACIRAELARRNAL